MSKSSRKDESSGGKNDTIKIQKQKETYQGVGAFMLEIVKIVILAFVIITPVRAFLFQPFFVKGASMEPNFEDGQYLIVNEFGFKETKAELGNKVLFDFKSFKELPRQRPVVFRYPRDISKFFIKRVIGLPGEKIQIRNNRVTIFNQEHPNGFVLDESAYLSPKVKTAGDLTVTLNDDEYFVMGDNRMFSSDSRYWGPVKKEDIMGDVLLRAWPVNQLAVY